MEQRGIVLSCVWGHGDPHSFYCRVFLTENQSTVAILSPVIAVLATLWLLINRIRFYFLFLYGWIAGRWEAHFRNYRHFVSQCPVSTLDWLSNFPHKAWVKRTAIACAAIEVHDHYTTAPIQQWKPIKEYYAGT